MIRFTQVIILATLAAAPALAQYTVDIYADASTDGVTLYGIGVMQYQPSYGCSMCASAQHTYAQPVQVVSPSGRVGYSSCGSQQSAASPYDENCSASLVVGSDYGDYTVEYTPSLWCNAVGTYLINPNPSFLYVGHGVTYSATTPWPKLGPDCPQQTACSSGYARCPLGVYYTGENNACYAYVRTDWLIIGGSCYGLLGPNNTLIVPADGPGPCQ